jgi:hypothetical protein
VENFANIFSLKIFQLYLQKLVGLGWGGLKRYAFGVANNRFNLDAADYFDNFNNLDKNLSFKFEAFIKLLQKDQVRIIFFIAPFHSATYKKLTTPEYATVLKSQEFFIHFAQKHKIEIAGSYNPENCGLNDTDFIDGMHPRETSTRKIFKNVNF